MRNRNRVATPRVRGAVDRRGSARGIAVEVPLEPGDGVPRSCVANADNVLTVPTSRLLRRVGPLTLEKLRALDEALRFALAL
jgi:mRNA-degrading endonuclease toxin of MazEF toxin-antitoxin module